MTEAGFRLDNSQLRTVRQLSRSQVFEGSVINRQTDRSILKSTPAGVTTANGASGLVGVCPIDETGDDNRGM